MRKLSYAGAIVEALRTSLSEDPTFSLVGSYVLGLGPKRVLMDSIRAEFPDRIFDPPTSEAAIVSIGAGAAMAGARPFVDIGTASFSYVGWSPLVNEAAVARYMSGGSLRVPVVYHVLHGLRGGGAPVRRYLPELLDDVVVDRVLGRDESFEVERIGVQAAGSQRMSWSSSGATKSSRPAASASTAARSPGPPPSAREGAGRSPAS